MSASDSSVKTGKSMDVATQDAPEKSEFNFQAEVNMLMGLIVNTIYTNNEVFLRELISNSSDALDKIKFQALSDQSVMDSEPDLRIEIIPDEVYNTLTIRDTGLGMTRQDLIDNLGTIAHSGTRGFMEALKAGADISMIGQFGVGFYAAFLVADRVTVISKHNDDEDQWIWESQAGGSFTVTRDDSDNKLGRGTSIILHLKDGENYSKKFLKEKTITDLVKKHSQYIAYKIQLQVEVEKEVEEAKSEDTEEKESTEEGIVKEDATEKEKKKIKVKEFKHLNTQEPIWLKPKEEVTQKEYNEFYKSFGNSWEEPLDVAHLRVEGGLDFRAILFIPQSQPLNLFSADKKRNNLKLYVRRVFIMDECEELCPEWLGFIKGIVDSEDLPLNLSRETLQHNKVLELIKRNIVRKCLSMFKSLSEDEEKYSKFYKAFAKNLKLGVHEDNSNRSKLMNLLRFNSSKKGDEMTSFQDYVDRMPEGQNKIYYLIGETFEAVKNSPFLEKLNSKGIEVLLMHDPIDEYVFQQVKKFKDYDLVSVSKEGLDLGESEDEKKSFEELKKTYTELLKTVKDALADKVEKVELSNRIVQAPAVLVSTEHGISGNMERILRNAALGNNSMMFGMGSKKIFELNADNSIIIRLKKLHDKDANSPLIKDLIYLLYETAVLTSGYSLDQPSNFANRIHRIVDLTLGEDSSVETETSTEEVSLKEEESDEKVEEDIEDVD